MNSTGRFLRSMSHSEKVSEVCPEGAHRLAPTAHILQRVPLAIAYTTASTHHLVKNGVAALHRVFNLTMFSLCSHCGCTSLPTFALVP
jgi:hypothetical protein